ncbi:MAG: PD-(D/E)XK nuclease family protein, partial [Bacteroidota bacterium]|nr:PD-(D/E)XK nuclease family protein [Bacteroidota bacterium]
MNKDSFLYRVAQNIIDNKEIDFENTLIILPNRRAKNFLFEYVCNTEKPMFLFDIVSIDDVVKNNIYDKVLMDKLPLLYNLYKSYCKVYYNHNPLAEGEKKESFSEFYSWGKILLNDFDEIDKHLVDAKVFYRNIQDYKNLQTNPDEYLSEEQKSLLERFFNIAFDSESLIIKNFVKVWNCLFEIYEDFNKSLLEQNASYSGKIYKDFAQRLEKQEITLKYKRIIIAGFSVLNQVERKIFKTLKSNYETEFYWDYDNYYSENLENEAGIFIRENIKDFPSPKSFQKLSFDRIRQSKQDIKIVKTSYSSFSLAYIKQWLSEIDYKNQDPNNIAIILLDESLIPMVLKSLPENALVNVTMGYPFVQTFLYNIIIDYVHKWVKQGFFAEQIDKDIRLLAKSILDKNDKSILWQLDVLRSINESLTEFAKSLDYYEKEDISQEILLDVIKKYLNKESADLISDATNGIQIMGLLETRCLDFKYVLMLSTSDNNLPKISSDSSFIPFSFKEAYSMMSVKRKTGLFAYYFYRLFHTAKRMDFVYNTVDKDKVQEMSRFLRQIKIELSEYKPIEEEDFMGGILHLREKKNYLFDIKECKFLDKGERSLSASTLNKLIDCEKLFYLSVIKGLSKDIEIEDYRQIAFGNMFHHIANRYYTER